MFKKIVLFACLSLGLGLAANAQSLEEILANHFEVIGQDKIMKVDNYVMKGEISIQGGMMTLPITLYQQRPGMVRSDVTFQGQSFTQAYDGKTGWKIDPFSGTGKPEKMSADEAKEVKEQGNMDGSLYSYKEDGHDLELVGTEDLEGTEVYHLKMTKKDGDVEHMYMDAENFVVLKVKSKTMVQGQEVEAETYMSNFKEIDGVIIPFSMSNMMNGKEQSVITITEVAPNTKIDKSMFSMPGSEGDAAVDVADAAEVMTKAEAEIDPKAAKKAAKAAAKAKKLADKAAKKAAKAAAKLKE